MTDNSDWSNGAIVTNWSANGFVLTGASVAPTQEILPSTQWSAGPLTTTEWIA